MLNSNELDEFGFETNNPFFEELFPRPDNGKTNLLRYDLLRPEHFTPALKLTIASIERVIVAVTISCEKATFLNTAKPMLETLARYDRIRTTLIAMATVNGTPEYERANSEAKEHDISRARLQFLTSNLYQRLKEFRRLGGMATREDFIINDRIQKSELQDLDLSTKEKTELATINREINSNLDQFKAHFSSTQNQTIAFDLPTQFNPGMPPSFF